MNLTVAVSNEDLNCKSIVDLIDNFDCSFEYCPCDNCGYVYLNNKTDLYMFCERIEDLREAIFYLNICKDIDVKY